MKICILSDLHCKHQLVRDQPTDTLLISNKPRVPANQHPVAALLHEIGQKGPKLNCDIILCPGDLGDKADEQGIMSSWTFLEEIKRKMGASLLIGIPGNHDMKSREGSGEAFSFIKSFHECFPTEDSDLNNKFWESGYCIITRANMLFLLVNTVHDHFDAAHATKSNVKNETLDKIEAELAHLSQSYSCKICMLHHHPIKHSNIANYDDTDSLENGDKLVEILIKHNFSFVLHGHKHQPRIMSYTGLPIFAAGSFASFANLSGTGIQLMFHILEFSNDFKKGAIDSWEFIVTKGWRQNLNIVFPPRVGFGADIDAEAIGKKIDSIFAESNREPILYNKIVDAIPELQYVLPDKLSSLNQVLRTKYSIVTSPELPLTPNIITELLT